jgi:hypothetical protein
MFPVSRWLVRSLTTKNKGAKMNRIQFVSENKGVATYIDHARNQVFSIVKQNLDIEKATKYSDVLYNYASVLVPQILVPDTKEDFETAYRVLMGKKPLVPRVAKVPKNCQKCKFHMVDPRQTSFMNLFTQIGQ